MMKAKFTKGEWSQSHRKQLDGMYITQVYDDKGETICNLSWHAVDEGNGVTSTDRDENAHLIAAAPDMYAALESHLSALSDLYALDIDDVLPEHEGEFRAVHALINKTELLLKKARGE